MCYVTFYGPVWGIIKNCGPLTYAPVFYNLFIVTFFLLIMHYLCHIIVVFSIFNVTFYIIYKGIVLSIVRNCVIILFFVLLEHLFLHAWFNKYN
jgi:hypothetical protein